MDGILIVDKPDGVTSHDVVSRVRRILGTRRVGHTGTLDPFATGVLVLLIGKATRLAQFIDKDEKEYEATMRFGSETDTGDREGLRIWDCGLRIEELIARLAGTDWSEVFSKFRGAIMQTPPMYSAKKVDGKKLYELARSGVEVERMPVAIFIHELESLDHSQHPDLRIRVVCSAGTYVRTLAEDIGRAIGVGAHLTELRRSRAGRFSIDQAVTLEHLAEMDQPAALLRPLTEAVEHLPSITLNPDRVAKTRDGLPTRTELSFDPHENIRMIDEDEQLIAVGTYDPTEKTVKPKIVLL